MIYSLFDYADRMAGEMKQPFADLPYLHTMCEMLERCVSGTLPNGKKNLLITIAPRCYKTTFVSRLFPAWCLAEIAPDCEFILTSYSMDLAVGNAMAIRRMIDMDWHKELYPHVVVDRKAKDTQNYFKTTAGGAVYAVGTGGTVTGLGAGKTRHGFGGAIVVDDGLKAQDAKSMKERQNCIDFYTGALKSRRNNAKETPMIVIQQRLHTDDLVGWILKNEPDDWYLLSLPAIKDNKVINPITLSLKELETLKEVDPVTFYAQYMQEPIIPNGSMIKTNWWRTYDPSAKEGEDGYVNLKYGYMYITADTAFKSKEDSDQSVLQCWFANRKGLYLIDSVYGRWEFPELVENAKTFYEKWRSFGVRELFIEDKASGTPLIQTMEMAGLPAVSWTPADFDFPNDKVGRVSDSAYLIHAGKVFLPIGKEAFKIAGGGKMYLRKFAADLVEQCMLFQRDMSHSHDDLVDTATMGISVYKQMV